MANHCVSWVILATSVCCLVISSVGIWSVSIFPMQPKPDPGEINVTETTRSDFGGRSDRVTYDPEELAKLKKYGSATHIYADYYRDPRWTLAVPSVINILVLVPLVLAGLCSRKIFSTTVGLHSSLVLCGINLTGFILLQNMIPSQVTLKTLSSNFIVLISLQISLVVVITLQVSFSAWELRRQKAEWPILKISNVFSLNAVFLTARIVVWSYLMQYISWSSLWYGLRDPKYRHIDMDWDYQPWIKFPEYYAYPVFVAIAYGIAVPVENALSHILGHVHIRMMYFTTSLSAVLFGMVAVICSPAFVGMVLSVSYRPAIMNFAIALTFLCVIHGILIVAKPSLLDGPLPIGSLLSKSISHPSSVYGADDIRTTAVLLRNKFKGKNVINNTVVVGLSSLAIILEISHEVWWWAGIVMVCGNVVVVCRLLPAIITETMFQKVEKTHILKELMHIVIECVLLFIGVVGSFGWFYGSMAAAILINILLIFLQIVRLFRSEAFKVSIKSLNTELSSQQESELLADGALSENEEQP